MFKTVIYNVDDFNIERIILEIYGTIFFAKETLLLLIIKLDFFVLYLIQLHLQIYSNI